LRNIVLTTPAADARTRAALLRALERFPAEIVEVAADARGARLRELAAFDDVAWIAVVDADAVLQPDAFGAVRRSLGPDTALVGGRALVGAAQRLGAMFGPARSGPNPFDIVPLIGPQSDRAFTDLVRGPIDIPQRGMVLVAAPFVRALPADAVLDPVLLHLDLAVYARALGRETVCEPLVTFTAPEDPLALRRKLSNLRHYAAVGTWKPQDLHRDPARIRSSLITREVRVMGNIRGYARRPYPAIDVLVVAADVMGQARAQRNGAALAVGGRVSVCGPDDGEALRAALAHTSDRYLLLIDGPFPDRTAVEALAERLERSGRVAVAFASPEPPFRLALFHCSRIVNAPAFPGVTVADVVTAMIDRLPERRLFAASPSGEMVPPLLPSLTGARTTDVVFVAASKPAVTQQTLQALMGEAIDGTFAVVYPAGGATTERLFAVHGALTLVPDDSDVQLAVGVNRALGRCVSDAVLIARDDVQVPHGMLDRLRDAFRRIPRLGIAVPRIGGADRPESLPDLGYRNIAEMQALYDRRAEAYAREASLLDVATAPVMLVSREVLEVVGGIDETFGFSRCGIEDFSRRVRAANFLVACCDDAYVHLFGTIDAASFVANLDDASFLRAAYEKRWALPRGFVPATDHVPLRTDAQPVAAAAPSRIVRIVLPLRDETEWLAARPLLVELAAAFCVHDPIAIAVGLDGTFGLQTALRELRELLIASGVPMEETLNVSIDFVPDIAAWRDAGANNARLSASSRVELAELPVIDGPDALRDLLADATL
jgi:hypothetical protein